MRRKKLLCWFTLCCLFTNNILVAQGTNSNTALSAEAASLLKNLLSISEKGFLFGHQDDLAYGVNWRYENGRSDVKEVSGEYPALYGWDLGGIENENNTSNLDGVPFKKMKQFIQEGYQRGGVITISWHANSPLQNGKSAWDTTAGTVTSILPGGSNHELYKSWLDRVAVFLGGLKGKRGELIPILFRPFHEHTGSWFWWGKSACSNFEYKTLWRFTHYYLQHNKKLNNLLWVYNTSGDINSKEGYLERYPGDDMVDVLSFDAYQYDDPLKNDWFVQSTQKTLGFLEELSKEKNKPFALAETGYEAIPYEKWWTAVLLKTVAAFKISFLLVWRNHGLASWNKKMHFYAPYKGHASAANFIEFYNHQKTIFESEAAKEGMYK